MHSAENEGLTVSVDLNAARQRRRGDGLMIFSAGRDDNARSGTARMNYRAPMIYHGFVP